MAKPEDEADTLQRDIALMRPIPPAPRAPSAQALSKVALAVGVDPKAGVSPEAVKLMSEAGPSGVTVSARPELDPNSEEVKLAKTMGRAGLIKKPGEVAAMRKAMNARMGVTEATKAPVPRLNGGRVFAGSEGSTDGLPPIRLPGAGAYAPAGFAPTNDDDEFGPTCGDELLESTDPLAHEILRTHPGAILGNLSRWWHRQGTVGHAIAEGLDAYMAKDDDLHRLENLASGATRIHCRKAVTPKLDALLAEKGGPATMSAVLRVGLAHGIEHIVKALSEGGTRPAAAPEPVRPAAPAEPVNVRAVAAAALSSSVASPRATPTPANGAVMPTPPAPAKPMSPFLKRAVEAAGKASAPPPVVETVSPSCVVDVTYTPANGDKGHDANRGIVDNIIFLGRQNGLLSYEAADYNGKVECHFKSQVFAGQFVKEVSKMGNGGANKAITGATIRSAKV